ncbi:hypothetical protein ISCGN_024162 [Ixodes scapularis]
MKPERRNAWPSTQAAPPGGPLRANENAAGCEGPGPTKMCSTVARGVWDFRVSPMARCKRRHSSAFVSPHCRSVDNGRPLNLAIALCDRPCSDRVIIFSSPESIHLAYRRLPKRSSVSNSSLFIKID